MNDRSILRVRGASAIAAIVLTLFAGLVPCRAQSQDLFAPIADVMRHPRCVNCHVDKIPLNGEVGRPHRLKITRGADGLGAPGARCYACHRDSAVSEPPFVPAGQPWQLAPQEMAWQGRTPWQLCVALRTAVAQPKWQGEKIIDHFKNDPLVSASWKGTPPRRPEVPIHQDQVGGAVEAWLKAGQPCP